MPSHRELPSKETLEVEFKSERKQDGKGGFKPCKLSDSELMDTVVALSNTNGGSIYLGVEDDGLPTGVHRDHEDATRLMAFIANKTVPPVSARVAMLTLAPDGSVSGDGAKVIKVEIPRSTAIVSTSDGKIMRRRLKADGTPESVPLYPYEIITRLSSLGQLDYSAFPVPDVALSDFDPNEIARLRSILAKAHSGDRTLLELPDDELLSALRMTTMADGVMVPTVTGILLVGKEEAIRRAVPTSAATFQVLEGTKVRMNEDYYQPLLYTIEKMREMLEPWNPEREFEDGLFRTSISDFNKRAYREALVNAFGHRDYAAMGRVRVLLDDEGLTIANPGGFIEGVTTNNLLTVEPRGRNECLMNALKRVGLAEKTGRGIDRIYEGSLLYGRPLPDYTATTSTCVSVFIARSSPDELFMRMLRDQQERAGGPLSLRALLVLDALKRQRRLTVADLSAQLNMSDSLVRSTVETLVESGLVEARGDSTARAYMLSGKVYAKSGRTIDFVRQADIDKVRYPEMILKLAWQQGGSVARRDVESLLRLNNKQAYRQIAKLVTSGELENVGRGGSAYYRITQLGLSRLGH